MKQGSTWALWTLAGGLVGVCIAPALWVVGQASSPVGTHQPLAFPQGQPTAKKADDGIKVKAVGPLGTTTTYTLEFPDFPKPEEQKPAQPVLTPTYSPKPPDKDIPGLRNLNFPTQADVHIRFTRLDNYTQWGWIRNNSNRPLNPVVMLGRTNEPYKGFPKGTAMVRDTSQADGYSYKSEPMQPGEICPFSVFLDKDKLDQMVAYHRIPMDGGSNYEPISYTFDYDQ